MDRLDWIDEWSIGAMECGMHADTRQTMQVKVVTRLGLWRPPEYPHNLGRTHAGCLALIFMPSAFATADRQYRPDPRLGS